MNGHWQVTVRDEFSAAHALRNYHGKCENAHGHNFAVEVCVEGGELDMETGMLLDFKTLKSILKMALANLDHRLLNEAAPFLTANPTSENLAAHIAMEVNARLQSCEDPQARNVRLKKVSVSEKASQTATWLA